MTPARQLPPPGSAEARNLGCICPEADRADLAPDEELPIDNTCPVHGTAADNRERAAERDPIDTEGDIVDAANEPELRRG